MSLEHVTIRVEPGVHGATFVKDAIKSDKPIRKALAAMVMQSLKDVQRFKGKRGMVISVMRDMQQLKNVMNGSEASDLGFTKIPQELEGKVEEYDVDEQFLFGVTLQDSGIMLLGCFYLSVAAFMAA